jgi:Bacterial Ig domain/PA14 domain/Secretion system C-terminal sorting domain/Galactose oxidase, central domain
MKNIYLMLVNYRKVYLFSVTVFFMLHCLCIQKTFAQTTVNISPLKDNTIYERNTGNSNGAGEFFIAGTTGSPYFNHALIMFDIAGSVPAGATIQSTTLTLHVAGTSGNSGPYGIELHKLLQNWGEGTSNAGPQAGQGAPASANDATWINTFHPGLPWAAPGGNYDTAVSAVQTVNGVGFYSWSSATMVTNLQNWLNNPSTNFGWLLKSNELASFQAKKFESRENRVVANRPVLSVTYVLNNANKWTWVKGDSGLNNLGIYTTTGANLSKPGARSNSASWKDASGNFWLFGGTGYDATSGGALNDLWKFDPVSNQWSWIKGDTVKNEPGIYGLLGISNSNNKPGARSGSFSWTDNSGNFWLFGGISPFQQFPSRITYHSDLWKYNPVTSEWTWMKGDSLFNQTGNHGTRGISAQSNKPGNRAFSVSWKDQSGNLWLFGGTGLYTINNVSGNIWWFNDMWKFNTVTNEWTWMKGDSIINPPIINYGIKGVAALGNQPGPLQDAVSWVDSSGNFWLFGGQLFNQYRNDLWKYSPITNEWTWVFGDSTGNKPGVYGIKGISASGNKPGARNRSLGWTDPEGNLWLFGGSGMTTTQSGNLNDLWKYNIQSNEWVWVSGDSVINDIGVYGTNGIAASGNKPGARTGSIGWADQTGNLWLFGGYRFVPAPFGYYNDLWKYTRPSLANKLPAISITSPANNAVFPAGSNITLNANASDTDGTITKVEFYSGGIKFAEDSTAPYGLTGMNVESGIYILRAVARDNQSGAAVSDTVRITISACTGSGSITGEGYINIPGTQVADLIANPAYPNNPSVTVPVNSFEYANAGDNYGARLRGYICAPLSGAYTFYIAGDDQAGLWLSTDENPANKTLIAYNETPAGFRAFTTFATQKSVSIHLVKGVRYYIETLHKQSTTANHLSVAWVLPNGITESPIPGIRLSPIGSVFPNVSNFQTEMEKENNNTKGLKVTAMPNPSVSYFTINTKSISDKPISVTIMDVTGRIVERKQNIAANGTLQVGNKLGAGVYFVEVIQGTQKQRLKLVKQ